MTSVRLNGAAGVHEAPDRVTIKKLRRYQGVFGPAFKQAVDRLEGEGLPRAVPERVIVEKPVVRTRTRTRTVVRDGGWRQKAEDARAATRAAQEQTTAAQRELAAERKRASDLAQELAEARRERQEDNALADRLAAYKARVERLKGELEEARSVDADARERATASELVADAERRVESAELRAARAERVAVEHAAAVTGQVRVLTQAELVELKANGPAGPAVMGAALRGLARARSTGGRAPLNEALLDVARAALHWRDRL